MNKHDINTLDKVRYVYGRVIDDYKYFGFWLRILYKKKHRV